MGNNKITITIKVNNKTTITIKGNNITDIRKSMNNFSDIISISNCIISIIEQYNKDNKIIHYNIYDIINEILLLYQVKMFSRHQVFKILTAGKFGYYIGYVAGRVYNKLGYRDFHLRKIIKATIYYSMVNTFEGNKAGPMFDIYESELYAGFDHGIAGINYRGIV